MHISPGWDHRHVLSPICIVPKGNFCQPTPPLKYINHARDGLKVFLRLEHGNAFRRSLESPKTHPASNTMKLTSVGAFSAAYVVCAVSAASQDYNTTLQCASNKIPDMCPAFLPAKNCDRTRQYSTKPLDTEIGFYPIELCVDISFGGCKPGGAKWGECRE